MVWPWRRARPSEGQRRSRPPFGDSYVGVPGTILLTLWVLLSSAVFLYLLVDVWPREASVTPSAAAVATAPATYTIGLFGLSVTVTREIGLFVVVGTAGALGASVHAVRSLYWYTGNRELKWSWAPMYVLLPSVGAVLGIVFYVVLRGGLFTEQSTSIAASPYGFAAVASLVGLFSEQAIVKLKQVFSSLLAAAETGTDSLAAPIRIDSFEPDAGGPATEVTIRGSGFTGALAVTFSGAVGHPTVHSDKELLVKVPEGAGTGKITVATPHGSATSIGDFTIVEVPPPPSRPPSPQPLAAPGREPTPEPGSEATSEPPNT